MRGLRAHEIPNLTQKAIIGVGGSCFWPARVFVQAFILAVQSLQRVCKQGGFFGPDMHEITSPPKQTCPRSMPVAGSARAFNKFLQFGGKPEGRFLSLTLWSSLMLLFGSQWISLWTNGEA